MSATNLDVVIVGGGPAGLTAAWNLRDRSLLLLDQSHRLGGRAYSLPRGDYWMNFGAHLFPAPGSVLRNLMAEIGLEAIDIPGNKFALWFDGKVYAPKAVSMLPFTLPLSIGERVAMARVGLRIRKAVMGWQRMVAPVPGESSEKRRARIASYMSDISFRDYLGPMPPRIEAIFRATAQRAAAEAEQFTAGVGASMFGMVWADKGKGGSLGSNLKGGSGMLGDRMTERLGERAMVKAKVVAVEKDGHCVRMTFERDGLQQAVTASQVIVAAPAFHAVEMVKGLPAPLAAMLRKVQYGPFPSMGVITNETGPMPWDDIYAITVPGRTIDMMFQISSPLRVGPRKPGSSFMVYAGGKPALEMMKLGEDQIRDRFLADMYAVYPQLRGLIAETKVQKWWPGNTYRAPGFDFRPMLSYCEHTDTDIHFAGDYFGELGNMETAAGTGLEAAGRVRARLLARGQKAA